MADKSIEVGAAKQLKTGPFEKCIHLQSMLLQGRERRLNPVTVAHSLNPYFNCWAGDRPRPKLCRKC